METMIEAYCKKLKIGHIVYKGYKKLRLQAMRSSFSSSCRLKFSTVNRSVRIACLKVLVLM